MNPTEASRDVRWLRLYQYEKKIFGYVSSINSNLFFFSPNGKKDPYQELIAADKAFSNNQILYGTLHLPASCAFPARREILEKLLNKKFLEVDCPDLHQWLRRINADRTSIVFVGAYVSNAASILGHTFLRFSNSQRENSGREGIDLLSYAVAYTAHADPNDGKLSYTMKGLTGGYPGYYDIEPYYMKVGLYNNSESRDLWDVPLLFSAEETELLLKIVWEYTFNSQIPYYFVGRNCSFRLLKLLEMIRPQLNVTSSYPFVVLPAETVRDLIDSGLAQSTPRYRPSILRRLDYKLSRLSSEKKSQFDQAKKSKQRIEQLTDFDVTDALLDYWLYKNYQASTNLSVDQQDLMETTQQAASHISRSEEKILSKLPSRTPPFMGHKPHWWELESGIDRKQNQPLLGISYRYGVHPSWSADTGYRDISRIEYLGFDYEHRDFDRYENQDRNRWKLVFVQAQTLENFLSTQRNPSWGISVFLGNDCRLCHTDKNPLQVTASYGLATEEEAWQAAVLAEGFFAAWREQSNKFLVAPGWKGLFQYRVKSWVLSGEIKNYFAYQYWTTERDIRLGYSIDKDRLIFLKSRHQAILLSGVIFF